MRSKAENMQCFLETGVMAIIRIDSPQDVVPTIEALARAGVKFIEISLVTPRAVDYINQAKNQFGSDVLVGAGTVLDEVSGRTAILAGADFLVTPVTRVEVIQVAQRYGALSFSGAYTPTEVLLGWESGADGIKIFPAMPAGPAYLKAIHAPLPQVPLVAVGGVTLDNLGSFFKAGACGVAGATNLADPKLVKDGRFEEVTRTAEAWLQAAREARRSA
jgi:2-dehydro-3-deoxyphosphogluconate aldolase/(4S)-4-hydroxy-2-oxoglutarate aldolase